MLILVLKLHNKLAFIPFFSVTNILSCRWLEKKIGIKSYLSSDRRRKIGSCFYWRTEMVTCISGAVSKYHLSMHNGHIYAQIMHFFAFLCAFWTFFLLHLITSDKIMTNVQCSYIYVYLRRIRWVLGGLFMHVSTCYVVYN